MRRLFAGLFFCVSAIACAAGASPEGRWEGAIDVPGRALALVVDLARDSAGAWTGSVVMPGLGLKGAPITNVVAGESGILFDLGKALRGASDPPATFSAHMVADEAITGDFSLGGNTARFVLKRTGSAQVEPVPRGTAVRREIEGEWTGEFELGGYPRKVTIAFENHAGAAATAKFVVVGKRTTDLPVDLVQDEGSYVRIESQSDGVFFEGRLLQDAAEIRGTVEIGPFELPLNLRRAARSAS